MMSHETRHRIDRLFSDEAKLTALMPEMPRWHLQPSRLKAAAVPPPASSPSPAGKETAMRPAGVTASHEMTLKFITSPKLQSLQSLWARLNSVRKE